MVHLLLLMEGGYLLRWQRNIQDARHCPSHPSDIPVRIHPHRHWADRKQSERKAKFNKYQE